MAFFYRTFFPCILQTSKMLFIGVCTLTVGCTHGTITSKMKKLEYPLDDSTVRSNFAIRGGRHNILSSDSITYEGEKKSNSSSERGGSLSQGREPSRLKGPCKPKTDNNNNSEPYTKLCKLTAVALGIFTILFIVMTALYASEKNEKTDLIDQYENLNQKYTDINQKYTDLNNQVLNNDSYYKNLFNQQKTISETCNTNNEVLLENLNTTKANLDSCNADLQNATGFNGEVYGQLNDCYAKLIGCYTI